MPPDVHVRVDRAGHQRAIAEVDVGVRRVRIDAHDLRTIDHNGSVANDVSASIEDTGGGDDQASRAADMRRSLCSRLQWRKAMRKPTLLYLATVLVLFGCSIYTPMSS